MSIIGDAIVVVKVDTSGARADLDSQEREERGERDKVDRKERRERDKEDRREGKGRRGGRGVAVLPSSRAAIRALPLVGLGILFAKFGPAAMEAALKFGDELAGGELPFVVRKPFEAMLEIVNSGVQKLDVVISAMEAAFGSLQDTTNIAKAAFIFKSKVDGADLLDVIEGQYRIRYAMGLGRRTETKLGRRLIGEGVGEALGENFMRLWE